MNPSLWNQFRNSPYELFPELIEFDSRINSRNSQRRSRAKKMAAARKQTEDCLDENLRKFVKKFKKQKGLA